MIVEVLVVGNEVLGGEVADTNSGDVARALLPLGLEVTRVTQVGDRPAAIAAAAAAAVERAAVLVVCGGLGPTPDDCTKEALAELFDTPLVLDAPTLADIRQRFAARGLVMAAANRKQAFLPRGAAKIPNTVGSAPGVHWRRPGCDVFALPGVPDELRGMLASYVVPMLRQRAGVAPPRRAVFRTVGVPESEVAQRLAPTRERHRGLRWGFYPGRHGLDVQVLGLARASVVGPGEGSGSAGEREGGDDFVSACAAVRATLGDIVYTEEPGITLAEVVRRLCVGRGHTLAVAESCTGGLLGATITAAAGSSEYFVGGFVTYANAPKRDWLGVPDEVLQERGAVSAEVAAAMASGARRRSGATLAVAVTGIAGPGGGTPEKPVGLVFLALATADGTWTRRLQLGRKREWNRSYACLLALDMLRRYELGLSPGERA